MKKSELKKLLTMIVEEVAVASRKRKLHEGNGLSGFKKSADSTEHTEKVADSKDLTGGAPTEKEEARKLPVVKKPATPTVMKEDIVAMIREELQRHRTDEMSRVPARIENGIAYGIGNKFKVKDANSPTGWSIKGHPKPEMYPDGMPVQPPKSGEETGTATTKTVEPSAASVVAPKPVDVDDSEDEEEEEDIVQKEKKPASKVNVTLDGKRIGSFDFRLRSGKISSDPMEKNLYRIGDLAAYSISDSVAKKYADLEDLFYNDALRDGAELNLFSAKQNGEQTVIAK